MMKDCETRLNELLEEICSPPYVVAALIARRDGIVIASKLTGKASPGLVAAMAATIVGTSEMVVSELDQGRLVEVVVEGVKGQLLGIGANDEAILVLITKREADAGMVLSNIEEYSNKISRAMGGEGQQPLLVEAFDKAR